MPVFNYKALKKDGGNEAGVIDADSPKEARLKLRGRSLHVTTLEEIKEGKAAGPRPFRFRRRRVKLTEVSALTRQLATLLQSGIPLMGALTAVLEQAEDAVLKTVLMDIREKVGQGVTFSDALEQHPLVFGELYVNMVRAGEAAGTLDKVMFRISDYLYARNRIQQKIMAALTYPAIMLLIGTAVVTILLAFVVPRILDVVQRHGEAALPLPTEILLLVTGVIRGYWWALLAGIVVCVVSFRRYVRTPAGKLWWDTFRLEVPVIGPLLRKAAISRFCVTFATLLESGVPVLESLTVVRRVVDNELLAQNIELIRTKVAEGADIATPLKQTKVFPPVVGYMIAVGEEAGNLEQLLQRIAQSYDEEVEIAAQRLTSLLEPLMIVVMALIVAFIVLSILLPIFQMGNL